MTLTPTQLAKLAALVREHGRRGTANLLATSPATIDCLELARCKPATVARVGAKLDELARVGHCGDTQRGCWRPGQLACVCRCVRCGP